MAGRVPARLTAAEGRRFAFTVGAAFFVLAALLTWRDHDIPAAVSGILAAALGLAGLLIPGRLTAVYRAWMGFALAISKVTTPIFMGIVYFVVLTPIGLARRAMGHNPVVHVRRDGSYFQRRENGSARRSDLNRQF